ncbi:hypothetical protein ACFVST_28470, partial [Streptomyces sp. NPDC058045]
LIKDVASRPDAEYLDQLLAEAAGERSRTILSVPKSLTAGHEEPPQPAPTEDGTEAESGADAPELTADTGTGTGKPTDTGTGTDETVGRAEGGTVDAGHEKSGSPSTRPRTGRRRRWMVIPLTLAAITTGLVFRESLLSFGEDKPPAAHNSPSATATSPTPSATSPSPTPSPTATKENLRTPAGARKVVREIKRLTGRTIVTGSFSLDRDSAAVSVPSKDGEVWNGFRYAEGKGEVSDSGGRMNDAETYDIAQADWDLLPRLIRITKNDLGLKKAEVTGIYVDLDDARLVFKIAASDNYGGAWLYADARTGKIVYRQMAS